ncbi:hypothetical protein CJ030_MR0G002905 [Morella rubra]|uniref:PGG domain-containing protein n=1 Tax=Morella rubra TaxID=262757 RepID=A0A6A1UP11_9ROSI|nr:hypothetical protein CJ030_MR0G002905 [Morella rubra]
MKDKVDMAEETGNKEVEEFHQRLEKAGPGTHLVVATLITTVTFVASITIPGGFVDNDGTYPGSPILSSAAFVTFVIFNNICLLFSSSAVLIHLLVALLPRPESRVMFLMVTWLFILVAMVKMVVAFVTASYAVLAHSIGLAIASCVIGSSFIPMLFIIFVKFYSYF